MRFAALLALVGAVVVVAFVVASSIDGKDGGDGKKKTRADAEVAGCEPEYEDAVEAGFYVVQEDDDAGLSLIAQRTCVPEEELIRLNPNIDPQLLEVGRCVNLEEGVCQNRET